MTNQGTWPNNGKPSEETFTSDLSRWGTWEKESAGRARCGAARSALRGAW